MEKTEKAILKIYKKLANENDFEIFQLDAQKLNNHTISSNNIRQLLQKGEIRLANEMLGYSYSIFGEIVEGNKIGRKINFRTANLKLENEFKLIPSIGVYATISEINGKRWKGMTNIGFRPTLNMKNATIETHIFDFNEDIYNKTMRLFFIKKIREEQKFSSIEDLSKQLYQDKINAQKILQNNSFS